MSRFCDDCRLTAEATGEIAGLVQGKIPEIQGVEVDRLGNTRPASLSPQESKWVALVDETGGVSEPLLFDQKKPNDEILSYCVQRLKDCRQSRAESGWLIKHKIPRGCPALGKVAIGDSVLLMGIHNALRKSTQLKSDND